MTLLLKRKKGDWTAEDMNHLADYLMTNGLADVPDEDTGFQESSEALCNYEVHVIKKRHVP